MKISEIARLTKARIEGNGPDLEITAAAGLDEAGPGEVTFLSNKRYTPKVQTTRASAIFLTEEATTERTDLVVLRSKDPYLAYTRALRLFHPDPEVEPYIHPSAIIDETARIADGVHIGAFSVIGRNAAVGEGAQIFSNVTVYDGVEIGAHSIVHSGVALRAGTEIGERVVIHNNAVIGSDGFGYAKDEEGRWLKIPQTGRVVIEDDVEIGACTTIDRASVGETRICRGAKVDNVVQIGHSCTVGEDTLLCAQVGLAGSSHIGRSVILAGQVGIAGHLTVGDGVVVTAKSATSHNVPAGQVLSGIPAMENREWLRATAAFRRLGQMQRTVRRLEERLAALDRSSLP